MSIFETYSQRQDRFAKAGQPDIYTYDSFSVAFKNQVLYILDALNNLPSVTLRIWDPLAKNLEEAWGIWLDKIDVALISSEERISKRFLDGTDEQALDFIELAFQLAVKSYTVSSTTLKGKSNLSPIVANAIDKLNVRFHQHGIGFEFQEGQLMRKDNQFLHEQAVKPALGLLYEPGFAGPRQEFLMAFEHLRNGNNRDAITQANCAFESTMKAIADSKGWHYDKNSPAQQLIKVMFDNGLIPNHFLSQFTSLRALLESSIPVVRNKHSGHGQGATPVNVPDYLASYALHMAASNIVLLVEAYKAS